MPQAACRGSRWSLRLDDNGIRSESDLFGDDRAIWPEPSYSGRARRRIPAPPGDGTLVTDGTRPPDDAVPVDAAFGLWKDRAVDGLIEQKRLRAEWDERRVGPAD